MSRERAYHDHGNYRRYWQGCRCDACRAAHAEQTRTRRWELAQHNVGGVAAGIKHGASTYVNHGCRCDDCTGAHSADRLAPPSHTRRAS